MSEDRTQAPTRQRRELARQRGHVARSADLTAASGLLAALLLLGAFGPSLATTLQALIRAPLEPGTIPSLTAPQELADLVRGAAARVAGPLMAIAGGTLATLLLVHQAQVGGLWAPALLAPDASRLLAGGGGGARAGRGAWSLLKAAALVLVTALVLRSDWTAILALGRIDDARLASAAGTVALRLGRWLAVASLVLGVLDFALAWRRVEDSLRQTPDEYREDLRAADGDPTLRSRRRRFAAQWRRDGTELLPGVRLVVLGRSGLVVLLAGGPPPERVTVRQVGQGVAGSALRREAEAAGLPVARADRLARHLARGRFSGRLPADLAEELRRLWPGAGEPSAGQREKK